MGQLLLEQEEEVLPRLRPAVDIVPEEDQLCPRLEVSGDDPLARLEVTVSVADEDDSLERTFAPQLDQLRLGLEEPPGLLQEFSLWKHKFVGCRGLEPRTPRLRAGCSAS